MAKKKKKKSTPKKTLAERRREALEKRKAIWSDLDLSKLYFDIKDLRGKAVPVETNWLYLITDYYMARLDDWAFSAFVKKMHPHKCKSNSPRIDWKWQYLWDSKKLKGKWVNIGRPEDGEFDDLIELFERGKECEYDIFPLELYRTIEKEDGSFADVELVAFIKRGDKGFEYSDFCGVDRKVSYWLHSPLIFKSDKEHIYAYDGWGFPIMCFNIEKDAVRDIDLRIWAKMFSYSAHLRSTSDERDV